MCVFVCLSVCVCLHGGVYVCVCICLSVCLCVLAWRCVCVCVCLCYRETPDEVGSKRCVRNNEFQDLALRGSLY